MTLSAVLPYDNGMPIHQFHIQHRVVQAFSKGIWSVELTYVMASSQVNILDDCEEEEEDIFAQEGKIQEEMTLDEKGQPQDEDEKASEEGDQVELSSSKKLSSKQAKAAAALSKTMLPSRKRITRMATGQLELTQETFSTHIDVSPLSPSLSLKPFSRNPRGRKFPSQFQI